MTELQTANKSKHTTPRWPIPYCTDTADDALPKFFKTANGVRVQELRVGQGPQAQQGDAVLIDFVLRRANGYFIYGEYSHRVFCARVTGCTFLAAHVNPSQQGRVGADHAAFAAMR